MLQHKQGNGASQILPVAGRCTKDSSSCGAHHCLGQDTTDTCSWGVPWSQATCTEN